MKMKRECSSTHILDVREKMQNVDESNPFKRYLSELHEYL